MANFVELMQKIAQNNNNASALTSILFGTVTSENPLKILVEQKMELSEEFFILTNNVKDYETKVTVNWETENTNSYTSHRHSINGTKTITIHNGLKNGETVILIQQQGGQKFVVLDRI